MKHKQAECNTTKMGREFGYPDCCISNFLKRLKLSREVLRSQPKKKLFGTGFVPCPFCNKTKTEEELEETIRINRLYHRPFPFDDRFKKKVK